LELKVSIGSDDLYPITLALREELKKKGFEVKVYGALETGKG